MSAENIKLSIDKSQIALMPIVAFKGDITVIDSPDQIAAAVDCLMQHKIIGFDTETRPSFQKGKVNKVALLQFSTPDHCFLFRINTIGLDPAISRILENEDILKIGLSVHDDFNVMHRSSQVQPHGFIELQDFVKKYGIADISLQKIYAILFGEKISKGQRLTNWEAKSLTRAQQVYAATDAWACLKIYNYLVSGEFDPSTSAFKAAENPVSED